MIRLFIEKVEKRSQIPDGVQLMIVFFDLKKKGKQCKSTVFLSSNFFVQPQNPKMLLAI